MRTLIKFNVGGVLTAIEKAVLSLTIHSFGGSKDAPYKIGVYRVTQPWEEGNGAEGASSVKLVPGTVGPDAAFGVAWEAIDPENQAAPKFDATAIAETTVDPRIAKAGDAVTWEITGLVRDWLNNATPNYGVLLRDTTTNNEFRELRFGAREGEAYNLPDKVAGPRLIVSSGGQPATPTFCVSAESLTPLMGQGIDVVSRITYPSIFSAFPTPDISNPTTSSQTKGKTITSSDEYLESLDIEASLSVSYKLVSGTVSVSWLSTQSIKSQTVTMTAMDFKTRAAVQSDFTKAVVGIDLSRYASYSDFVKQHGSHFIGGYIGGTSYSALCQATRKIYSEFEKIAASAKVNAPSSILDFNAKAEKVKVASGMSGWDIWEQSDVGWPDSAPPLVPGTTASNIETNIRNFLALKSEQLTNPIAYLCYDWRMIPAIRDCRWARDCDIDMRGLQMDLPDVSKIYQQLKYVRESAQWAINAGLCLAADKPELESISAKVVKDLRELEALSIKDIASLDIVQFEQKYYPDTDLIKKVLAISKGKTVQLKLATGETSYNHVKSRRHSATGTTSDVVVEFIIPQGYRRTSFKTSTDFRWDAGGWARWEDPNNPKDGRMRIHVWVSAGGYSRVSVLNVMAETEYSNPS